MSRAEAARSFLAAHGWADAEITPLAGDASNRRYDRLKTTGGRHAVLMDAPPDLGEDVRPFTKIARWLTAQGLSAPQIIAEDAQNGFLIIEDLGDGLFAREMARDPDLQSELYSAAVSVLVHTHGAPPPALNPYDAATTAPLAGLAFDWYQAGASDAPEAAGKARFLDAFEPMIAAYDTSLDVLVQRDFHAENLLWLPGRSGVARVGLLDFQDAMLGHRAYDLVSIVQDARRDVPVRIGTGMVTDYIAQTGVTPETFKAAYAVFGVQRNLRILGVFARLCLRDNKAHYVDLIPRVWGHLLTNLEHPDTDSLRPLLLDVLPEPRGQVLETLKQKAGSWAGR